MDNMTATRGREPDKDCVRAISMLYIVGFWHLFDYIGKDIVNPVTSQITYGVLASFTFISGYFLGQKKITDAKSVFSFWFRRLIRFYPLFVVSCVMLWKIGYIGGGKRQLLLTVMGLSCVIPPAAITAWYLTMLMIFYFVTPFINMLDKKKFKFVLMFGIELVMVLARVDSRLYFYWPFYCAAILLGGKFVPAKVHYIAMFLSVVLFSIISIIAGNEIGVLSFICVASFVVFLINVGKLLEHSVLSKLLRPISYASMCAYLFHRPFYFGVMRLIGRFSIWVAYIVILPVLLVMCYGIQWLYDRFIKELLYRKELGIK